MKYYTGVGSRQTPKNIQDMMTSIATKLSNLGYVLRTGDAVGADAAFSLGVPSMEMKHKYNANDCTQSALNYAATFHPAWNKCSSYAKKLHGRNVFQVLGNDMNTPSSFLICWTPDGCVSQDTRSYKSGGTATAIVIAEAWEIPIFNLQLSDHRTRINKWLGQ